MMEFKEMSCEAWRWMGLRIMATGKLWVLLPQGQLEVPEHYFIYNAHEPTLTSSLFSMVNSNGKLLGKIKIPN